MHRRRIGHLLAAHVLRITLSARHSGNAGTNTRGIVMVGCRELLVRLMSRLSTLQAQYGIHPQDVILAHHMDMLAGRIDTLRAELVDLCS